jgi:hypothetical protein
MIEISRRSWKRLTNESKKTPPKRNFFCKLFRRYGLSDYCLKELVEAALVSEAFCHCHLIQAQGEAFQLRLPTTHNAIPRSQYPSIPLRRTPHGVRSWSVGLAISLCLSEIKHAHTDDEVRQETA